MIGRLALAAILICAVTVPAAARHRRAVCVPTFLEGVGVIQICPLAPRRHR